jgi:hypothetical protein
MTGHRRTSFELQQWADEHDMEVVELKSCPRPSYAVEQQFRHRPRGGDFRYFRITTISPDHVRRSGIARVHNETSPFVDLGQAIDFVWFTTDQLNWMDRPPRRLMEWPHDHAQGWHADQAGEHELRWYSAGTPTDLVKDGAIESRDPPLAEFRD